MKGTSFYEEQMGMAFDSIPCGLCIYQIVNGQILPRFRNPAFYEILGYSDTHRSDAGQGLDLGRVAQGKAVHAGPGQGKNLAHLPVVP